MRQRWTIEKVRDLFEREHYKLLSTEYKSGRYKFEYVCDRGHKGEIRLDGWLFGRRCRKCYDDRQRLDLDFIRNEFKKEGYILLSDKHLNCRTRLKYICPLGHKGTIYWNNWKKGSRCRFCSYDKLKKNIDIIKGNLEIEGYSLLSSGYTNNKGKLELMCPNGHIYEVRWNDFSSGYRCPSCNSRTSKSEKEIYDFLIKYMECEENSYKIIPPYELDIFIPSKDIAIEYCGLYWHSENKGKDKNYHLDKLNMCNEKGIKLVTIFEDEWIHKQKIVESRLKQILNCFNNEKIYARKCEIGEIDTKTKDIFLEGNHLQGKDNSSIKLGAIYNGELVSVMTFSQGNTAKGSKAAEGVWELNRFCSKINYRVVGIASKLFKYFIKNYNPKEIYSYSDRRWSIGNLYEVLGFEFIHHSKLNYWYIQQDKRIHRFNFRKSELSKKLYNFDSTLTEWQNMQDNGYNRIWDCGNTKWVWRSL